MPSMTSRPPTPGTKIHLAQFNCGAESRTNKRNWSIHEPDVTCIRCRAAINKYHTAQAKKGQP